VGIVFVLAGDIVSIVCREPYFYRILLLSVSDLIENRDSVIFAAAPEGSSLYYA
jgi:hypothetical protein